MSDALRAEYRKRLAARLEALEATYQALSSETADAIPAMRRMAHMLRGSGATFGFPRITESAAAVEDAPDDQVAEASLKLLEVVREVAGEGDETSYTILLVEDNAADIAIIEEALTSPHWHMWQTGSVAEAEGILAQNEIALVVLDLILPEDDGRRLLNRIRNNAATSQIPVFVVSARLAPHVKAECFSEGADAFFEKPVDPILLRAAVASRLSRARPSQIALAAPILEPPAPVARARTDNKVVLFAEDDELIASVVVHRLGREGFDVRHYPDGVQALEAAKDLTPGLLILDVRMPGLDGFEVLAQLREMPAYQDVPAIILTSLGNEKDIARGFDLGASDYMVKPFSPAELITRVRRLIPE